MKELLLYEDLVNHPLKKRSLKDIEKWSTCLKYIQMTWIKLASISFSSLQFLRDKE